MANILQLVNHVQQQGELGRQRGQQNRLAQLSGMVMDGDRNAYREAAAIDPAAAQGYQQTGDNQLRKLQGFIRYVDDARATGDVNRVNAALKAGSSFVGQIIGRAGPTEWTPDMEPGWEELKLRVMSAGGTPGAASSQNKVVGGALVTPDGQVVYEAPVNGQIVDLPDGMGGSQKMIFDPRTRALSPLAGGASADGQAAAPMVPRQAADGSTYRVGADLSPAQLAAAAADMGAGGTLESVRLPDESISGGRLGYTPPKQREAPQGYNYVGETLAPIPGGPADNTSPQGMATGEQGLRKEVANILKQDQSILSMYRNVQATARNPSAAGDLSMIFAFMKMLDPGSVVREQEFANAQNAAGVPDRVRNAYNRLIDGERLNPSQRADFLGQARQLASEAESRITAATRQYQGIARQYGYDPVRGTGMADFSGVSSTVDTSPLQPVRTQGAESPRTNNIDALLEKYR